MVLDDVDDRLLWLLSERQCRAVVVPWVVAGEVVEGRWRDFGRAAQTLEALQGQKVTVS